LNKQLRVNAEYSSRAALSRLSPFEAIRGADFLLERVRADSGGFHLTSITLEPRFANEPEIDSTFVLENGAILLASPSA